MNKGINHKVLVIDDNDSFLETLLIFLKNNGFQALGAKNGQLGLQLAKEQMPDLIICDINMSGFDGYDVLRRLRQDSITQNIPLIFLTIEQANRDRYHALELGANDYLDKFCGTEEIVKAIKTQLEIKNRNISTEEIANKIDNKIDVDGLNPEISSPEAMRFIDWRDEWEQKGREG